MSSENKYAVIKTGGQQFVVRAGDKLKVNRLPGEQGAEIVIDQVLSVSDNGNIEAGTPLLNGRSVKGKIVAQLRGPKLIAYKKKRRKGFHWKRGHRQELTEIQIDSIN